MNGREGSHAQTCNTVTEGVQRAGHTHAEGGKWEVPFTESLDNDL